MYVQNLGQAQAVKCSSCMEWQHPLNYSKNQLKKGNRRRCKTCIQANNWSDNSSVSSFGSNTSSRSNYSNRGGMMYQQRRNGYQYDKYSANKINKQKEKQYVPKQQNTPNNEEKQNDGSVNALQEENEKLRLEIESLRNQKQQEINDLNATISTLKQKQENGSGDDIDENQSLNNEIEQLKQQNETLHRDITQYQSEKAENEQYQNELESLNKQQLQEIDSLKVTNSKLNEENKSLRQANEEQESQNKLLQQQNIALQQEQESQNKSLKQAKEEQELQNNSLQQQNIALQQQHEEQNKLLQQENNTLKQELAESKQKLQEIIANTKDKEKEAQISMTEKEEDLKEEPKEKEIMKRNIESNKENEANKEEIENLRKEIEKTKSKLSIAIKQRDIGQKNLEIQVLKHKQKSIKNKRLIQQKLKEIDQLEIEIEGLNREQDRDELENDFLVVDKGHNLSHKDTLDENDTHSGAAMVLQMGSQPKLDDNDDTDIQQKNLLYSSVPNTEDQMKKGNNNTGIMDNLTGYFTENYPIEAGVFLFYAAITFLSAMVFSDDRECIQGDKIVSILIFIIFAFIPPLYRGYAWYYLEENVSGCKIGMDVIVRMLIFMILMLTADLRPILCFYDNVFGVHLVVVVMGIFLFLSHLLINKTIKK